MDVNKKHVGLVFFGFVCALLWAFPSVWYAGEQSTGEYQWFGLREKVAGWDYTNRPVGDAAEAILVADHMTNGEYRSPIGQSVRVFSAKRYVEKENAVGLFSHTPDRCWTNTGMFIEPEEPFHRVLNVHGIEMSLERRVFTMGSSRELVYFGAIVGGEALPYRLDQYLGSGMRNRPESGGDRGGTFRRLFNTRVWSWALESFVRRTRLAGPQQLIRISTPVYPDLETAEKTLEQFLPKWLYLTNYEEEKARFEAAAAKGGNDESVDE